MLCALAIGLAAAPGASAAIKLGVYSGAPGKPTAMEDPRVFDHFIEMVGTTPAILHDYRNVTDPLLTQAKIDNITSHGVTPMITWQLFKSGWSGSVITLPDIAAGRYDGELREAARMAKGLQFEILIRFAHEMNGDWYPWRPGGEAGNVGTNYVDAWRHIVSIFRQEGAGNVKWVWCPNVDYGDYPFAQYFPGDAWVDYVALDGYNWGTSGMGMNKWQSLYEVFAPSYEKLTQMSSKPVMIAETSASEHGGDKAAWIRQGMLRTIPERFPRVAAVVWFDRDMEQDWRVNSSQSSLEAFREVASSTIYGGDVVVPLPADEPQAGGKKKNNKGGNGKKTVRAVHVTPTVTATAPVLGQGPVATRKARKARRGNAAKRRFRGRIVYRLAHRARVRVTIERRSRRGRFVRKVSLTRQGKKGRNRIGFNALKRRVNLKRGVYRVAVVALDDRRARRAPFRVAGLKRGR